PGPGRSPPRTCRRAPAWQPGGPGRRSRRGSRSTSSGRWSPSAGRRCLDAAVAPHADAVGPVLAVDADVRTAALALHRVGPDPRVEGDGADPVGGQRAAHHDRVAPGTGVDGEGGKGRAAAVQEIVEDDRLIRQTEDAPRLEGDGARAAVARIRDREGCW